MKTYIPKKEFVKSKWYVVDASGKILGRMASRIAHVLRGKHRPDFTPHLDLGDHVVVINAGKVALTGRKASIKTYFHHTGYPGGLKKVKFNDLMKTRPERVIEMAVWGMLPHTRLGRRQILKLKVYAGSEHPHVAQQPEPLAIS
ncbi:MAG: 50S ribosomal protein L13 [bacterium]